MCKTGIEGLCANNTDNAIIRRGKAVGTLHSVLEQFHTTTDVSGAHKKDSLQEETHTHSEATPAIKCIQGLASLVMHTPHSPDQQTKNIITWIIAHVDK